MACQEFSKVIMIIFNGLFLLASLIMLGLGIALVVNPEGLISFANNFGLDFSTVSEVTGSQFENIIKAGGIFMIALGILVGIIAFMGFCGACCDSSCLLVTYVILMVVIIAGQVALIIFVVVYPKTLTNEVSTVMKKALEKGFKSDVTVSSGGQITNGTLKAPDVAWMVVQFKMQCCGGSGIDDYSSGFSWNRCGEKCTNAIAPVSCCKLKADKVNYLPKSEQDFENFEGCMRKDESARQFRNEKGCAESMIDLILNAFQKARPFAIGIASVIIAIEVALIIISCCIIRD